MGKISKKGIPLFLVLVGVIGLSLISVGAAGALPLATPFTIPTSTPAGGMPPASDRLTEEQLFAINLAPEDVPAEFAANPTQTIYTIDEVVANLQQSLPQLADQMQGFAEQYGWTSSYSIAYTTCDPNTPISAISSEIAQLESPEAAQQWIDDPAVRAFYSSLGFGSTDTDIVHGFFNDSAPVPGDCFASEITYGLNFEYQGLLIAISMVANVDTDPELVKGLISQLVPVVTAKVDAVLSGAPITPTPKPPSPGLDSIPLTGLGPTPAAGAPALTLESLVTLAPTYDEIELAGPALTLNEQSSGIVTQEELVTNYTAAGYTDFATVMQDLGGETGLIGQSVTLWDTAGACPTGIAAASVELDLTLFATADGAQTFAADPSWIKIWEDLGFSYEPYLSGTEAGYLISASGLQQSCGTASFLYVYVPHGSVLITAGAVAMQGHADEVQTALDGMIALLIERLDGEP